MRRAAYAHLCLSRPEVNFQSCSSRALLPLFGGRISNWTLKLAVLATLFTRVPLKFICLCFPSTEITTMNYCSHSSYTGQDLGIKHWSSCLCSWHWTLAEEKEQTEPYSCRRQASSCIHRQALGKLECYTHRAVSSKGGMSDKFSAWKAWKQMWFIAWWPYRILPHHELVFSVNQ